MSDPGFCKRQVMRLKSIDKWLDSPENRTIVDELAAALRCAASDVIASVVIDNWITGEDRMPTPASIRRLVEAENARAAEHSEAAARTAACAWCGGTGFEIVERGGLSGAKICRCRTAA
jgi:hypothetical protein